jgi:hypothetical protein
MYKRVYDLPPYKTSQSFISYHDETEYKIGLRISLLHPHPQSFY